jgi:hypothetical protein
MEASSSRPRIRPIVVDFLATLLVTFCIGVGTALVLTACVMLMAGEARGAEAGERASAKSDAAREAAPAEEMRAKAIEFALTHHLVTRHIGLITIERTPARAADRDSGAPRLSQANRGNAIPRNLE